MPPPTPPVSTAPSFVQNACKEVTYREIWSLTWPQALTMLFQFLIGLTDVTIAGYIHPHVQSALGIVSQSQFFIMVVGIALVNGGLAAMSQALGAELPRRASRYVGLMVKMALFFGLLTIVAGYMFRGELMRLLGVSEEILGLTLDLWVLLLFIMPASFLNFASVIIFRAYKNVSIPLGTMSVVCVVNVVADLGFGLGWFGLPAFGAKGLIWASIISVSVGALVNIVMLHRKKILTARSFAPWRWEKRALPYMIKVALPAGGSQMLWQLGNVMLYRISNTLPRASVIATAGLTAGRTIEALMFLPGMAFSFTGSILVGHCLGAGNKSEAKRVGLRIVTGGSISLSILAAILMFFVDDIAAFVSPDPAVAAVAKSYLVYNLLATPFTVTSMIMAGIFSGAGATLYSLTAFSTATWLVRLPLAWYMGHIVWEDASGIFIAMLCSQVVQAGICVYLFMRRDWYRFASTAKRYNRDKTQPS